MSELETVYRKSENPLQLRQWGRYGRFALAMLLSLMSSEVVSSQEVQLGSAAGAVADEVAVADVAGYEGDFSALGTVVSLKAFSSDREQVALAFEAAERRVRELEATLTDYNAGSETRLLTSRAAEHMVPVSKDLWAVLVASNRWHKISDGAFDAGLGSLTALWRKYRRAGRVPESAEVQSALEKSGWRGVELDPAARQVRLTQADLRLDFGGIGKGYIVDEVYEVLVSRGLPCCLVNISGNMRCGTAPPDRAGWRIEVSPLEKDGQPLRRVVVENRALATSGDLWQFMEIDGQRRSHILNPKTGMGVLGPVAATVVAQTATDADAFATVACIVGPERAVAMAKEQRLEVLIASKLDSGDSANVQQWSTAGFPVNAE